MFNKIVWATDGSAGADHALGYARDLARIAGRNKQTIAAIVDELENLGYVHRADDPADRRAKLIVPTARGRQRMRAGDKIVADIEKRHEAKLGRAGDARFKQALRAITADGRLRTNPRSDPARKSSAGVRRALQSR